MAPPLAIICCAQAACSVGATCGTITIRAHSCSAKRLVRTLPFVAKDTLVNHSRYVYMESRLFLPQKLTQSGLKKTVTFQLTLEKALQSKRNN